jgi:hypothetical protein
MQQNVMDDDFTNIFLLVSNIAKHCGTTCNYEGKKIMVRRHDLHKRSSSSVKHWSPGRVGRIRIFGIVNTKLPSFIELDERGQNVSKIEKSEIQKKLLARFVLPAIPQH